MSLEELKEEVRKVEEYYEIMGSKCPKSYRSITLKITVTPDELKPDSIWLRVPGVGTAQILTKFNTSDGNVIVIGQFRLSSIKRLVKKGEKESRLSPN
jgi:hypothetical protein